MVNFLLIAAPSASAVLAVWFAPDRNLQYMLTLTLFSSAFGYTTLALPMAVLVITQAVVTILFVIAER